MSDKKSRFTAVKEKLDSNFDSSDEIEEQDQESETNQAGKGENNSTGAAIEKANQKPKPAIEPVSTIKTAEVRMTRKTTAMPLALALAVKELKDRRNLAIQKGKGRTTDDDIIVEALKLFFSQKGEYRESLDLAENRLRTYS